MGSESERRPPGEEPEILYNWTVRTTQLVMDGLGVRPYDPGHRNKVDSPAQTWVEDTIKGLLQVIMGETPDSGLETQKAVSEELEEIIAAALYLDKKLCLRIPPLDWRYNLEILKQTNHQFDPKLMELREDNTGRSRKKKQSSRRVQVVVAPALVKRSDSAGRDASSGDVLVQSIVRCK